MPQSEENESSIEVGHGPDGNVMVKFPFTSTNVCMHSAAPARALDAMRDTLRPLSEYERGMALVALMGCLDRL